MPGGSLFETFMGRVGGFATHVVYRCLSDQKLEPGSQFCFLCLLRQELISYDHPYYRDLLAGHFLISTPPKVTKLKKQFKPTQ